MPRCRPVVSALGLALLFAAAASGQSPAQADSASKAAVKANSLPLIATRSLRFTTDQATWVSLDLAPDGRTIVFELLGDLYTLPIGGGTATRITSGLAFDMQPRYSADGKSIVFVTDRNGSENVWIADSDGGNARALTTGERENYVSPVWSPDGRSVVATKGSQLGLFYKDGGTGVQLTGNKKPGGPPENPFQAPGYFGAAFGRDPRFLWLNVRGTIPGGVAAVDEPADLVHRSSARQLGSFQVGQLDRETGRIQVRTHELEGAFRPLPSPDGRGLSYTVPMPPSPSLPVMR